MKIECLKVCEGIHYPGTPEQWIQTFSPGKEYELPPGMVRELIKDGKMREIQIKTKKEGRKDGKD